MRRKTLPCTEKEEEEEVSVNSVQSDNFSDDCSGEKVNVEGHVAIDNGNSGEGDVSTFSLLGCNSAHIRLIKLSNVYAMYIFHTSILTCQLHYIPLHHFII